MNYTFYTVKKLKTNKYFIQWECDAGDGLQLEMKVVNRRRPINEKDVYVCMCIPDKLIAFNIKGLL